MQTKSGWQNNHASANLCQMIGEQHSTIVVLRGPVPLTHFLLRQLIQQGDTVIDATCGKGNDTLLLAELVGVNGLVWAFDIQEDAVSQTVAKLADAGHSEQTRIIHSGHETMHQFVQGPVKAIIFNLGYLPGGERNTITRPDTTCSALVSSAEILMPGGVILVTIYPGHQGGEEEMRQVEAWSAGLPAKAFHVWRMGQTNVTPNAPYLLLIQKAAR